MTDWVFRGLMAVLATLIVLQLYVVATARPRPEMCLLGIVMQQHEDMWVQKGMWPSRCVPIDKD